MKTRTRKQATDSARKQSSGKNNTEQGNRIYAFRADITNQYYREGEYYTQVVSEEKSFNLSGKEVVAVYQNGKKIR